MRELTYLSEASEQEKLWTEPLLKLLLGMEEAANETRQNGSTQASQKRRRELTGRYN